MINASNADGHDASAHGLFKEFWRCCDRTFVFLESTCRLSQSDSTKTGHEARRVYESEDLRVVINFEPFSRVWIILERKIGGRWRGKGLQQIYKRALGEAWPLAARLPSGVTHDFGDIPVLGEILQKHWKRLIAAV